MTKNLKNINKQLNITEGQIKAIKKMLLNRRTSNDILIQLKAIHSGINKIASFFLEDQIREQLFKVVEKSLKDCPGECNYCNHLDAIKRNMDKLDIEALSTFSSQIITKPKNKKNKLL